jgi:hypothetical protein
MSLTFSSTLSTLSSLAIYSNNICTRFFNIRFSSYVDDLFYILMISISIRFVSYPMNSWVICYMSICMLFSFRNRHNCISFWKKVTPWQLRDLLGSSFNRVCFMAGWIFIICYWSSLECISIILTNPEGWFL